MKEVMIMENYSDLLETVENIQTLFYAYKIDIEIKSIIANIPFQDNRTEKITDSLIELRDKLQALVDKQNLELADLERSVSNVSK